MNLDKEIINLDNKEKKMHKVRENGIYLSDEQIEILNRYDINYQTCSSVMQLIYLIDDIMEEEIIEELDKIATFLEEHKYYHNTNK